jgi:hypothetical protein
MGRSHRRGHWFDPSIAHKYAKVRGPLADHREPGLDHLLAVCWSDRPSWSDRTRHSDGRADSCWVARLSRAASGCAQRSGQGTSTAGRARRTSRRTRHSQPHGRPAPPVSVLARPPTDLSRHAGDGAGRSPDSPEGTEEEAERARQRATAEAWRCDNPLAARPRRRLVIALVSAAVAMIAEHRSRAPTDHRSSVRTYHRLGGRMSRAVTVGPR